MGSSEVLQCTIMIDNCYVAWAYLSYLRAVEEADNINSGTDLSPSDLHEVCKSKM